MIIDFIIVFGALALLLFSIILFCLFVPIAGLFFLAAVAVIIAPFASMLEWLGGKLR